MSQRNSFAHYSISRLPVRCEDLKLNRNFEKKFVKHAYKTHSWLNKFESGVVEWRAVDIDKKMSFCSNDNLYSTPSILAHSTHHRWH